MFILEIISVGFGLTWIESIYELYTNENGMLAWKKTEQELKYPRSNTIAMRIQDEFVICKDNWN